MLTRTHSCDLQILVGKRRISALRSGLCELMLDVDGRDGDSTAMRDVAIGSETVRRSPVMIFRPLRCAGCSVRRIGPWI